MTVLREVAPTVANRILGLACAGVLCITLFAGLTPFHAPKNNVAWLVGSPGLHFGRYGTAMSSGALKLAGDEAGPERSLEIWLTPATMYDRKHTMLATYTPQEGQHFSLYQAWDDLLLNSSVRTGTGELRQGSFHLEEAIEPKRSMFVTVASGPQQTSIWVNGSLKQSAAPFPLALDGSIVVANSAVVDESWPGDLRGLAIYESALTPARILSHYETWKTDGRPQLTPSDRAVALYVFDEGRGDTIHNRFGSGPNLYIPQRFLLLHEKFLEPFWQEFSWSRSYWKAVLINVVGLVPLGFTFCAYFVTVRGMKRPALAAIVLGFLVSLTIEVTQAFLPTRDSGTSDLITNTLGTALGCALYLKTAARVLLAKVLDHVASAMEA